MKWITRARPKTDRIACPWLIRRFVDPSAEIMYISHGDVLAAAERERAHSFDAPGAEFDHRDGKCTFEQVAKLMAASAITARKSGGQSFLAGKHNFMETVIVDEVETRRCLPNGCGSAARSEGRRSGSDRALVLASDDLNGERVYTALSRSALRDVVAAAQARFRMSRTDGREEPRRRGRSCAHGESDRAARRCQSEPANTRRRSQ
jgi:hypothetical protein